jgi:hypothetical protein
MTTLREAAQQALEALEELNGWQSLAPPVASQAGRQAAINLRAALEQPEQEPVAWRYQNSNTEREYLVWNKGTGGRNWTPLFTHPPRREWRSLSEEEIAKCWHDTPWNADLKTRVFTFARAIEQACKERNP